MVDADKCTHTHMLNGKNKNPMNMFCICVHANNMGLLYIEFTGYFICGNL